MSNAKDPSSLVHRLRSPGGFADEFARLRPFIRKRVADRLDQRVRSRVDPSDILQDTFVVAQARISVFLRSRPMLFRNWLKLLARQLVIGMHRRHVGSKKRSVRRENANISHSPDGVQLADRERQPVDSLIAVDSKRKLTDLFARLSPSDRRILTLRHLEEKSNQEVATLLGISPIAASKRHSRALQRLREFATSSEL